MALIIVTGDIDSGKTTWCKEVLLKQKPGSDGILLIKRMTGNNFIGYDAFRILNGDTVPFARRVGLEPQDWQTEEKIGNFSISQKGKETANRWIYEAASRNCIVIDEVGYLEVRCGGLYESVQYIINQVERKDIFLVVQLRCIDQVCSAFQIKNYRVLSAPTIPHTKMSTLDRESLLPQHDISRNGPGKKTAGSLLGIFSIYFLFIQSPQIKSIRRP